MRLRGIKIIEEGNTFLDYYLPIYNRRFALKAKERDNLHRDIPRGLALDKVLCIKTESTLRNDFTVAHNNKLYQIGDKVKASKVIVHERINGSMAITYKGTALRFKEILARPIREKKEPVVFSLRKAYIPSVNHPWSMTRLRPVG